MASQVVATRAPAARPDVAPRSSRLVLGALVLVALLLMARVVLPLASALLFAAVLAGALHPWLVWLAERLGGRRQAAALVLTGCVVVLLVAPVTLLSVSIGAQVVEGVAYVRETLRDRGLPGLIAGIPPSLKPMADWVVGKLPDRGEENSSLSSAAWAHLAPSASWPARSCCPSSWPW